MREIGGGFLKKCTGFSCSGRGFLAKWTGVSCKVDVVFLCIAKVKSTHSPRPKTGV